MKLDTAKLLKRKKLISIVVPAMNEADNLSPLVNAIQTEFKENIKDYSFEIIFVDDGSTDRTIENIQEIIKTNKEVHYIELSRNFGKEVASTAGLHSAKGDAVIIMDADLQHPPYLLNKFIAKWETGSDVVIGVHEEVDGFGFFKKLTSRIFHKVYEAFSAVELRAGESDYRLLDRKVVDEFEKFTERARLTRGLINWMGYKKEYIEYKADERLSGEVSYNFRKRLAVSLNSILAYSYIPLKMIMTVGAVISLFSFISFVILAINNFIFNDPLGLSITGTAIIGLLILAFVGLILISLGLVSLYIKSIHVETQNRPLYIVRSSR